MDLAAQEAFKSFDADGSGTIDPTEFTVVLADMEEELDEAEQAALREIGRINSGADRAHYEVLAAAFFSRNCLRVPRLCNYLVYKHSELLSTG